MWSLGPKTRSAAEAILRSSIRFLSKMSRDCTKSTRPDLTHTVVSSPSQLKQTSKEFEYEAPPSPTEEITKVPLPGFWLGCRQDYSSKEPPFALVQIGLVFENTVLWSTCKRRERTPLLSGSDVNRPFAALQKRDVRQSFLYGIIWGCQLQLSQTVWLKSRFEHAMNVVY